jgi:alkanesulfonate monooxygenase SsuD/methylene tetrahydromethanopterin reductase-like flavin-dependent oxidoreductase (luciferase family)
MAPIFGCNAVINQAPEVLRAQAQQMEAWGYDSVWVADHIVIPRKRSAYRIDGTVHLQPERSTTASTYQR